MSVFTTVTLETLNQWLSHYAIGQCVDLQGIAAGIENTNYFATLLHEGVQTRYVLTLFEKLTADELPFYLNLMQHLSAQGLPCAAPVANSQGQLLTPLCGKPASLVHCLSGQSTAQPSLAQCASMGGALARLHLAGLSYPAHMANPRGAVWRTQTLQAVLPFLAKDKASILQMEVLYHSAQDYSTLPQGVIHADLFRDNALFEGDKLGGIIDLYFACCDALVYDVAITVNDWAVNADGVLDAEKKQAFLAAYQAIRPFTPIEQQHWKNMLRLAALRFWLSRLYDLHLPREGEMTHAKDPDHFYRVLVAHYGSSVLS